MLVTTEFCIIVLSKEVRCLALLSLNLSKRKYVLFVIKKPHGISSMRGIHSLSITHDRPPNQLNIGNAANLKQHLLYYTTFTTNSYLEVLHF